MTNPFRKAQAQLTHSLDQKFELAHEAYNDLSADQRATLKAHLQKLAEIGELSIDTGPFAIRSQLVVTESDGENDRQSRKIKPHLLLRAIVAWDKGEPFDFRPTLGMI
jgi:hypothetical protein